LVQFSSVYVFKLLFYFKSNSAACLSLLFSWPHERHCLLFFSSRHVPPPVFVNKRTSSYFSVVLPFLSQLRDSPSHFLPGFRAPQPSPISIRVHWSDYAVIASFDALRLFLLFPSLLTVLFDLYFAVIFSFSLFWCASYDLVTCVAALSSSLLISSTCHSMAFER